MITCKNLNFSYDEDNTVLNNITLNFPTGKFSLLVGPTGCGKSTLLKILAGLYPKYAGNLTGTINWDGLRAAMMFQNAGEQFTMATPREEIIFALENLQVSREDYQDRLNKAVQFAQIHQLLDQKINTMSGGEQQRVALAVLVAMDVSLFLLDEPFASCDPKARTFLIAKLAQLRDQGKTIILSDHVLSDYKGVCDCLFHFTGKTLVQLVPEDMNLLLEKSDQQPDFAFALPQSDLDACFTLRETKITQNRLLLDQDRLDIVRGKTTLITGANGVGKSSLFSALTKMIPYSGSMTYRGKEIRRQASRTYLRRVGQIFQTASDQFINITVQDEINLSKKQRTSSFFTDHKIKEALNYLELDHLLDRVVYSLSGGQQKKLQILLMLIADLDVLLIDEPLSGLDHESARKIMTLLQSRQQERGQTLVIISHELVGLADWCDYHLVFKNHRLTYVDK